MSVRPGPALLAGLLVLTAIRLAMAASVPLAPDEAYYWVFSRALAPGYLDHPPMVALWIRLGTELAGPGELGVRLLGPFAAALGSVLLWDAAEQLWPGRRAGVTAALLLNATLMLGAGAVIMTPDTPLLFFWTACLWALARLLRHGDVRWWLAVGLFSGLALDAKYTAALLPAGIVLWLLWVPSQRQWWRSPMPWAAAALGALTFLPVLLWNARHGWVSFIRQGGRVGSWQPARAAQFLGELVGGQIGLATPLVFLLFVAGAAWAVRRALRDRDPASALLAALTLPGAALFLQHAIGDRVQGNWPGILYPAAALAAAGLPGRWLRLRWPAAGLGFAMTLLMYVQASRFALPLPADPIARQLAGWDGLAQAVAGAAQAQGVGCVAAEEYGTASELARALPARIAVLGVDPRWRLFRLPGPSPADARCLLLRRPDGGAPAGWQDAHPLGTLTRLQGARPVQTFAIWQAAAPPPDARSLPR